jgi:glutaredoxin
MNSKIAVPAIFLLGFLSQSAGATKVYECIGASGKTTFSDHCPPGTRKKETQFQTDASDLSEGEKTEKSEEKAEGSIILYSVERCDACDLVRNFLKTRKIPFTEKNVTDDMDLQKEIREKSGSVTVPVTMIGGKTLRGYDSYVLSDAIIAAGYSDKIEHSEPESDDNDMDVSASLSEKD